ncbi:MAG TPA: hypothetical protein VGG30_09345 [Pirellulales bacterium]|jgi:hypothetical protein
MPLATHGNPATARVERPWYALGWALGLLVVLAVCLRGSGSAAAEPQSDPPLPRELSVWNWLQQNQSIPSTSFARWQLEQQNPGGQPEPALWNAPINTLVPVPEVQQASAIGGLGDTRLNRGTLIEAAAPLPPPPLGRRLTQTAPIELAQQTPPPDTGIQSGESPSAVGGTDPPGKAPDGEQKLGKSPIDYSRQFLRTQAVLVKQGQCQFDTGAAYGTVQSYFPTIVGNTLTQGFFHRRLAYVPAQIRYGLTDRLQLYANCPVGYVCSEQSVLGSYANYSGRGGTGDTNVGVSYWLRKSNGMPFDPDVIATVGMTIPSAPASFLSAFNTPQTSLGQGFWAATWNLLVVQSFDPVTIFYGVGGRQLFGKDVDGSYIQPGQQFTYQLGAGFAVNERVTFSASYFGYLITDTYIDHARVPGSVLEPQYMRFAVTVSRTHRIIEPYVLLGTTADSARSIIGINITFL